MNNFADDVSVRNGNPHIIFIDQDGGRQRDVLNDTANALYENRVAHNKGTGQNDIESRPIV